MLGAEELVHRVQELVLEVLGAEELVHLVLELVLVIKWWVAFQRLPVANQGPENISQ